jgi:methylenetetrahydrofolate dehydrogenase (NADP+)/methenyltetrahydrofolate cyclohydrolase
MMTFLCPAISRIEERPLTARLLNGNAIRDQIYDELKKEIGELDAAGVRPGLAAVLVGDNPASKLYVNSKVAACEKLGLASFYLTPPATISTEELLALVDELNRRDDVDGILVQMPLPPQIDSKKILEAVLPEKDVDGFHPVNVGKLVAGRPHLVACTPLGVMEIFRRSGIALEGANTVVMGRSDIVGKPMALLLIHANATVTVCHSKTRDLPEVARRADIVLQFLTEAVVLTGLGGLIGMTMGWMISLAAHFAFPSLPTAVPLWAASLGVVVSIAVGLFFGIWPANKAARLDPVVALRYE